MAHPYDIEHAANLHVEWMRDLAARMEVNTTHQSGPQMRAVMLELRRSIDTDCVLTIANALPTLERGIFLEGWRLDEPRDPPANAEAFAERVYDRVKAHRFRVPSLVGDVFWLWSQKLDRSRSEAIRACLPDALSSLWPASEAQI